MPIIITPKDKKKDKKEGYAAGGQAKQRRGFKHGGTVSAGSSKLKPTNQSTVKAKGSGAATRGTNFKV